MKVLRKQSRRRGRPHIGPIKTGGKDHAGSLADEKCPVHEITHVVRGMPRCQDGPHRRVVEAAGLHQVRLGNRLRWAIGLRQRPQRLQASFPQAGRRRQMRNSRRVAHHAAFGKTADHLADAAGVIEMDMGQKDPLQVFDPQALQGREQRRHRGRRPRIHEKGTGAPIQPHVDETVESPEGRRQGDVEKIFRNPVGSGLEGRLNRGVIRMGNAPGYKAVSFLVSSRYTL